MAEAADVTMRTSCLSLALSGILTSFSSPFLVERERDREGEKARRKGGRPLAGKWALYVTHHDLEIGQCGVIKGKERGSGKTSVQGRSLKSMLSVV